MCLLVTQTKNTPTLPDVWLSDMFSFNSDGIGVMSVHNNQLVIKKELPKTANEFIKFYKDNIQGKNCSFHLRMRTHGEIDLLNCHPYEILNKKDDGLDMWLSHNGILSFGNDADKTKSDTWHYIKNYLKPMLKDNPSLAFNNAFIKVIGDHIGSSNKFVIMDSKNRQSVINRTSGVYWGGMWLSNTYAWSAPVNVSKKLVKDSKQALKDIQQLPIERVSYKGYYPSMYASEYETYDSWDYYEDIEQYLDSLSYCGFRLAFDYQECVDFIDLYGINNFYDIMNMALDGTMMEKTINDVFMKPHEAKNHYSWLNYKSTRIKTYKTPLTTSGVSKK